MEVKDKVCLVTGAASGIGAATCRTLIGHGATVVASDIDVEKGTSLAREEAVDFLSLDVSDCKAWDEALAKIEARHGGLDILICNAGILTRPSGVGMLDDPLKWISPELYDRVSNVNIKGVLNGIVASIPYLEKRDKGAIVVTASLAGLMPQVEDPLYSMTKHAVIGLVRSLAPTLDAKNISISAICPGGADTPLIPNDMRSKIGDLVSPPSYMASAVLGALEADVNGGLWVAIHATKAPWLYEYAPVDKWHFYEDSTLPR